MFFLSGFRFVVTRVPNIDFRGSGGFLVGCGNIYSFYSQTVLLSTCPARNPWIRRSQILEWPFSHFTPTPCWLLVLLGALVAGNGWRNSRATPYCLRGLHERASRGPTLPVAPTSTSVSLAAWKSGQKTPEGKLGTASQGLSRRVGGTRACSGACCWVTCASQSLHRSFTARWCASKPDGFPPPSSARLLQSGAVGAEPS